MRVIAGFAVLLGLLAAVPVAQAKLRFTRDDGSVIAFTAKPRVWCGPWDTEVKRPSLHVAVRGRRRHWDLSAVRRDVKLGRRMKFPNEFVFNKPRGAELFPADAPNEASTNEEEASGSMTFTRASCRHGAVVAFTIDAVLGSELSDLGPINVTGSFRGHVASAPPAKRMAVRDS